MPMSPSMKSIGSLRLAYLTVYGGLMPSRLVMAMLREARAYKYCLLFVVSSQLVVVILFLRVVVPGVVIT